MRRIAQSARRTLLAAALHLPLQSSTVREAMLLSTSMLERLAMAALVVVSTAACSSEDKSGSSGAEPAAAPSATQQGASAECVLPAPRDTAWVGGVANAAQPFCAAPCSAAIQAMQLDANAGCRRLVVLGCATSFGGGTDGQCFKSPTDGRLVQASGAAGALLGWPACTEAERAQMTAPPCE